MGKLEEVKLFFYNVVEKLFLVGEVWYMLFILVDIEEEYILI